MCKTKTDVVRAWKDEDYRMSLSDAERKMLPSNPAGLIEISDVELGAVGGGDAGPVVGPGSFNALCSLIGGCQSDYFRMCTGCIVPCTGGDFFCPIFPEID
jgi:mersacidin/lichenicidin family type 2 lantibiotic